MEEVIKKYDALYEEMASSRDPARMVAFGDAEKWIFHQLAHKHPEVAQKWVDRLEASKWYNYLSEEEAKHILASFMEKHGNVEEQRYEWEYETLKQAVISIGGTVSEPPYYNCYALWVTMNMLYSDHSETVSAFIQPMNRIKFFYKMAEDKLKDVDRPHFVREYFLKE